MAAPKEKQRHGCLTAWLVVFGLLGVGGVIKSLIAPTDYSKMWAEVPAWMTPMSTVLGILGVVFLYAIFKWKKIGVWGTIAIYLINFPIMWMLGSHAKTATGQVISPLFYVVPLAVFLAIFVAVLFIGNEENKAWPQFE